MAKYLINLLILAMVTVWSAVFLLPDDNLHIVFCDVGQGDGILLTWKTTQVLVDTGLDSRIVDCLSDHIPFYDKQIELVMITHPQHDHIGGIISVAESYSILQIVIPPANNEIKAMKVLKQLVEEDKVEVKNLYTNDKFQYGPIVGQIIWPRRDFVAQHIVEDAKVLGATTDGTDLNSFSIVAEITYGDFDLLLTGDADHQVQLAQIESQLLTDIDVLKVPHHGGKQAILPEWVAVIKPEIAVISAGKNNSYGHPRKETLDILSSFKIQIHRTDLEGTIEIVTDGRSYWFD